MNIAEKVVENSAEVHRVHFGDADLNPIQTIDQPVGVSSMGWPTQVLFYQPELEGFIRSAVAKDSNITLKEDTELIDFEDTEEGVSLKCVSSDSEIQYRAKFLIGCDGASSFIRKKLDVGLEDFEYNQEWLVCDAHLTEKVDIPENEAMQICDPKRPGTYVPGRRGHLRFEFKKMPGEDSEELEKDENVWKLLKPWINESNATLERAQVYAFHACIAESWCKGNILIAGDAAHQMPPFLGQGLCQGIKDSYNLCWKLTGVINKSFNKKDADPFIFYEGPPSANGKPGIHHVMARTIKDIFCRYKTQKGFQVHRKAGWDTHGLPVELGVEKELGITKEDIGRSISVSDYNEACKKAVMKYTDLWNQLTQKMGYWVDMENPYVTYTSKYIESVWWLLKQIHEKGMLYKLSLIHISEPTRPY